jgi:hypothetical protein
MALGSRTARPSTVVTIRALRGPPRAIHDGSVRAKRPARPPVILARDEVRASLQRLEGVPRRMAGLLYGAGLWVRECCRLRVQDVDVGTSQIVVRAGKGDKDRVTLLPAVARAGLAQHLETVRAQHREDLAVGAAWGELPRALPRKYPDAGREWAWQEDDHEFCVLAAPGHAQETALVDTPAGKAFRARQYDVALAELEKMVAANPRDALALRFLAITLDRLGRYREAIRSPGRRRLLTTKPLRRSRQRSGWYDARPRSCGFGAGRAPSCCPWTVPTVESQSSVTQGCVARTRRSRRSPTVRSWLSSPGAANRAKSR